MALGGWPETAAATGAPHAHCDAITNKAALAAYAEVDDVQCKRWKL